MLLAHRIRLDATEDQRSYFARAAGTQRRVWNWALAEWDRQVEAGGKPNAYALKRQFNAIKYSDPDWLDADGQAWLKTMHRDSHAQPFAYLARAYGRYFDDVHAGRQAHKPRFKKKGRCPDSFYVANDKFRIEGKTVVLPKIGRVKLTETLRFKGKIMGATVQREAEHWYIAVQVEVDDLDALRERSGDAEEGLDLGINSAVALSTGEKIFSPRPLKAALRRLKIRSRRQSRKLAAAKREAGISGAIPRGTRLPVTKSRQKGARKLACLHARIAAIRKDFTHKLTTRICRENQTVVIEDLNVKGMLANHCMARGISDVGFGRIRAQLQYKAVRYGTRIILADRWYPSSKLCSDCGWKYAELTLAERNWTCRACGAEHDRDHNAAKNLKKLATQTAEEYCSDTALPVASRTERCGTADGMCHLEAGKSTPVRYEYRHQEGSGPEMRGAHKCALF